MEEDQMRRLVLKMSMTIDGYVAGPEGEMDWAMRTAHPDGKAWIDKTLREAGAHLIGRKLYEQFVGYWPTSTDPVAEAMNEKPKIVFSRTADPQLPSAPGWEDPRVFGTDLVADLEALKAEDGGDLLAQGGVEFGRSLVRSGQVDEYRLVVHPVVLGEGQALFAGAPEFDLDLVDVVRFPSGSQALTYRPVKA
jgi:dihydrofolate reductase